MFLKMLKSELKQNKGLNTVLMVFMAIASVLVFAGAVQIYSYLTAEEQTAEHCNMCDVMLLIGSRQSKIEERRETTEKVFGECEYVQDFQRLEMTEQEYNLIDFDGFDEENEMAFKYKGHYITTVPENYDLVFDLNDEPFTVPNGCIAVPVSVKNMTGAKIGDKVRITTEMGNIFELTVCGFFKDQLDTHVRYMLSEEDYKVISADSHYITDMYSIAANWDNPEVYAPLEAYNYLCSNLEANNIGVMYSGIGNMTNEAVMMMIVSVFVLIISVFMILIILMTIRFTIIAALKEEEKEIGMMRAMGVESFAFRWLFSAKYIGFALLGGVVGVVGGLPVSKLLLDTFSPNMTAPPINTKLLLGTLAVLAISVVMVLFSVSVMRRINKISVIDAIHGENRGERFGNSTALFLYKRNKMPVPLYLAVSDILKRFKRYLFLLISYVLGISVLLITFNLRNTVISEKFMCYSSCYALDFDIKFNDGDVLLKLAKKARAAGVPLMSLVNEDMKNAGIPAEIDIVKYCLGDLIMGDSSVTEFVYFEGYHPERYTYRKGGTAPKLENEIAMSYFTAKRKGLQVGDTVTLSLPLLTDDGMSREEVEKQFVITGFIDAIEDNGGSSFIFVGGENSEGYDVSTSTMSQTIFAEGREKKEVIKQIEGLYKDVTVYDGDEYAKNYLSEYDRIFALLEYIMGGIVIFVTILMTYLYMNIFIAEETREIALMKSMGFTDGGLRAWQLSRLMILTASAAVLAIIFVKTAGTLFIRKLFEMLELTGFSFAPEYLFSFCIIPVCALLTVCAAAMIKLSGLNRISINRINEE